MKTLLPALLLLSTSTAMFAQRPGGGPPRPAMQGHIETMTTLLTLSTGQQAQATAIYNNARAAEKAIGTNMNTAHTALQAAIKKNDIGAIDAATAQLGSYHAQTLAIQSKAEAAFYATLSPEQQTKYDTLHRGGFGGPGGGPRGGPRGEMRGPRPPQQ